MPQNKNIWESWFNNLDEFSEDFTKILDSREFNQNIQKRNIFLINKIIS